MLAKPFLVIGIFLSVVCMPLTASVDDCADAAWKSGRWFGSRLRTPWTTARRERLDQWVKHVFTLPKNRAAGSPLLSTTPDGFAYAIDRESAAQLNAEDQGRLRRRLLTAFEQLDQGALEDSKDLFVTDNLEQARLILRILSGETSQAFRDMTQADGFKEVAGNTWWRRTAVGLGCGLAAVCAPILDGSILKALTSAHSAVLQAAFGIDGHPEALAAFSILELLLTPAAIYGQIPRLIAPWRRDIQLLRLANLVLPISRDTSKPRIPVEMAKSPWEPGQANLFKKYAWMQNPNLHTQNLQMPSIGGDDFFAAGYTLTGEASDFDVVLVDRLLFVVTRNSTRAETR